ncbi:50S ribosomal protein L11 methyltransferase [Conexibacter sp. DBS9H8]|uniref:50S ribosomal protein L11 methyltransferase n=1 Tax=Conexibacter sp. DBS9H8 TaxID=2937801 RepID=UPI00200D4C43|nr:50S ribosomal protein L11 methyltransferase [Conexibacter sp. DBS9H8]
MIRLAVRVHRANAEVALAELLELAPAGVEEVDLDDGVVEYAVYGQPGELPSLPSLEAAVGGALVAVSTTEVADDWAERWRAFHRPLHLGGRLTVRPPWEPADSAEHDIVIDPGQAFGTGAHATTALCLELLLELPLPAPGARGALDLGCGSGVLAILAARLGWEPVRAVDFDPLAVAATEENAARNGVSLAEVRRLDLRREPVPPATLVLANLLAPLLLRWCEGAVSATTVIASGLLVEEADRVAAAFAAHGLREVARRGQGEWAALRLDAVSWLG